MPEDFTKTVRIQRPAKAAANDRDRSVGAGKVESVELELVSTTALERMLKTADGKTRAEIRNLADSRREGVLARDTATGMFQIVSNEDLRTAVEISTPRDGPARGTASQGAPLSEQALKAANELSLVSTQILRKVVKPDDGVKDSKPKAGKKDKFGGFNPYDNG